MKKKKEKVKNLIMLDEVTEESIDNERKRNAFAKLSINIEFQDSTK